jgi:hypothetical protein
MNSKGHLYISIAKSGIRILAAIAAIATNSLIVLAVGVAGAEVLGVLEELVDFR